MKNNFANNSKLNKISGYWSVIAFYLGVFGFFYATGILMNIVQADYYYRRSQTLFNERYFEEAYDLSEKAIVKNRYEPYYHIQKAKTIIGLVSSEYADGPELKSVALGELRTAVGLNKDNLVIKRDAIPVYYFLVRIQDMAETKNNEDTDYKDIANQFYSELISEYPNDVGLRAQIAIYQKRLSLDKELNENLESIKKLRPDILEWYLK